MIVKSIKNGKVSIAYKPEPGESKNAFALALMRIKQSKLLKKSITK